MNTVNTVFLIYVLLCCLYVAAFAQEKQDIEVDEANDYVDHVIQTWIEENAEEIEPYALPGITKGFSYVLLAVNVSGEMTTYDGYLNGLSTIERVGDSKVTKEGEKSRVVTTLQMGVLDLSSKAKVEFMQRGPSINIEGRMTLAVVETEIVINENKSAQLEKFILKKMSGFDMKISGLGPLSFMFNMTVKLVKSVFRSTFKWIIQSYMKNTFAKIISHTTQGSLKRGLAD